MSFLDPAARLPLDVDDEFRFWTLGGGGLPGQDNEHQVFLQLGLVGAPDLQRRAAAIKARYDALAPRALDRDAVLAVVRDSQALKADAIARADAGWVGWLWPAFLRHIKFEVDYFLRRVAGQVSLQEEACAMARVNAEHAFMGAKLIDPAAAEAPAFEAAMAAYRGLASDQAACASAVWPLAVDLTRRHAAELDRFNRAMDAPVRPRSVIHPVLGAHIVREGARSLAVLDQVAAAAGGALVGYSPGSRRV